MLAPAPPAAARDARLAALAAGGDERAFEVLYDRHHRALLGFCRHMVGTREEAEDALQQTFLRAHRALLAHGAPDGSAAVAVHDRAQPLPHDAGRPPA